jgi:hypothetical protein
MTIKFTDRYGGRTPSWLRGCFGECEALGFYPVQGDVKGDLSVFQGLSGYELREVRRIKKERGPSDDGWYFVRCPDCHGTGRCSWWITMTRIPEWFMRGVRWCWFNGPNSPNWSGHPSTYPQRAWLTFKIAFLCDLGWRI